MKILDRYILKEFLKFIGITVISLVVLFLIVDFFEKIRMFLSNQATATQMASYFIFSIPMIISYMLPPAVLLATLLTYSSLSKFSEITAMKANGISLYRISIPPLIFAVLISIFLFFFNELITPAAVQKTERIIYAEVQKQTTFGFFKQNEIWYRGENAIYNFKMFDVNKDMLLGITINYFNPDFTLKARIDAKKSRQTVATARSAAKCFSHRSTSRALTLPPDTVRAKAEYGMARNPVPRGNVGKMRLPTLNPE